MPRDHFRHLKFTENATALSLSKEKGSFLKKFFDAFIPPRKQVSGAENGLGKTLSNR